jgi:hypothetical protein
MVHVDIGLGQHRGAPAVFMTHWSSLYAGHEIIDENASAE